MTLSPFAHHRRIPTLSGIALALALSSAPASSQTTYVWNGTASNWTQASGWTPTRTTPATNDVLVVDGAVTPTAAIGSVPIETIGRLRIVNAASAALSATANNIIVTLQGTGTPALEIETGATLSVAGNRNITLALTSGATASIGGTLLVQGAAHRLTSTTTGTITVLAGGVVQTGPNFSGGVFGTTGLTNVATFQSGASYVHGAGGDVHGLPAPATKVVFQPGSTAVYETNSGFVAVGRTYANLLVRNGTTISTSGNGAFQFHDLTVEAASQFTHSGSGSSTIVATGSLSIAGAKNFALSPGSGGLTLNGGGVQTIGGGGTGTVTLGAPVTIAAGTTVSAQRPVAFSSGAVTVNGTLRIETGGGTSGGTFAYAAGGALVFANPTGTITVAGSSTYWPAASGPPSVHVLGAGGISMSVARSVSTLLEVAGPVGNANQLTVNGTLRLQAGGGLTGSPTYGAASTLEYRSTRTLGAEWGAGVAVGVGVPRNVTVDASGGTVTIPTGDRSVPGNVTIANGTLALDATSGSLNVGGNWASQGALAANGRAVVFQGVGTQTITRPGGESFDVLQLAKPSGDLVLAASPATPVAAGKLVLGGGRLVGNGNVVTIVPGGIVQRTAGWVEGALRKTVPTGASALVFEVGSDAHDAQVDASFASVSAEGTLTVETDGGDAPGLAASLIDPSTSINRRWILSAQGLEFSGCDLVLRYGADEVDPGTRLQGVVAQRHDGVAWSSPATGAVTSTSGQVVGLDAFGTLALGERTPHTITASAGSGGTVVPLGPVSVRHRDTQAFAMQPDSGYRVLDVMVDGLSVGAVTSYTFVDVTSDHVLAASFEPRIYQLTVQALNGAVTRDPDLALYPEGTVVQLTATPDPHYHFAGWSGDATGTDNPLSVTMDTHKTITALFAIDAYPLAVSVVGAGAVSRSPDLAEYGHGSVVELTAQASPGHTFVGWSGAATGLANPIQVTMDGPRAVTAAFAVNQHTLTLQVTGSGSIERAPDQSEFPDGYVLQLTAVPSPGWWFAGWSGGATGASNPLAVTMNGSKTIRATFTAASLAYVRSRDAAPYAALPAGGGTTTLLGNSNDGVASIRLPFTFPYAGTVFTTDSYLAVGANGYAYFTRANVAGNYPAESANSNLYAAALPNLTLAPWYDDLSAAAVGSNPPGTILYRTDGAPGSRTLTVQWTGVSSAAHTAGGQPRALSFQIVLFEASGAIEFRYGPAAGAGAARFESASIGLEDSLGGNAHYLDAVTGSRLTSNGMQTTDGWPTAGYRFTPGAPTPIPGGAYAVGAGGAYAGLSEAVAELNHRGVAGPVTLNLTDAVQDTSPAGGDNRFPILLGPVAGSGPSRPITIAGAVPGATLRSRGVGSGACGTQSSTTAIGPSNEPVLALIGADDVTIEDLVVEGGPDADRGVLLLPSSRTDGARGNTLREVRVDLTRLNPSAVGIEQAVPLAPSSIDGANSFNRYHNVVVEDAYSGIALSGNAASFDVGCEIATVDGGGRTVIGGPGAGDLGGGTAAAYGIRVVNQRGARVFGAEVRHVAGMGGARVDGIRVENQGALAVDNGVLEISRNHVHDLENLDAGAGRVTGIAVSVSSHAASTARVFNNFVHALRSGGTSTTGRGTIGIHLQEVTSGSGGTLEIDFNSVRLDPGTAGSSACVELGTTSGPRVRVRNNVLVNATAAQSGGAKHYAWVTPGTTIGPTGSVSDHNILYVPVATNGFAGRSAGVDRATLPDWQAATSSDAESRRTNPEFVDPTDLHVHPTNPTPVESGGSYFAGAITWVGEDIDGQLRNPVNPDIGADEGTFVSSVRDVAALLILAPPEGSVLVADSSVTPQAEFENRGFANLTGVPVSFRIVGPLPDTTEAYLGTGTIASIPSTERRTVSFPPAALARGGAYRMEARASAPGDVLPDNDVRLATLDVRYTLTATVVGNGQVARTPALASYPAGSSVALVPAPDPHWHFVGWSGDTTTTEDTLVVTMDRHHAVTATFAIDTHTLQLAVSGNGMLARDPDLPAYDYDSVVQITATPAEGWHFVTWSGDDVGSSNPLVLMMRGDRSITGHFAINTYAISTSVIGSGTVTRTPYAVSYPHGSQVELAATPAPGWHFVGWEGDTTESANPILVGMVANRTFVARFAIDTYTLSLGVVGQGMATRTPDQPLYEYGTTVTLAATPAVGWHFVGWTGSLMSTAPTVPVYMDSSKVVTATFAINTYPLDVTSNAIGSVARAPDAEEYDHGTVVQLTAQPHPGAVLIGWSGDASGNASPINVTMTAPRSIQATFGYPLQTSVAGSGTVSASPDSAVQLPGTVVTLTALPQPGWHFTYWSGSVTGTSNPVTVTMDGPKSATAHFAINTYALDVTVAGSGSVGRAPDQPLYDHGTVVQLTATPAVGWHFVGWSGAASGSTLTVPVTMDGPKSVTATFAINTYMLSVSVNGQGSVQRVPNQSQYAHGTAVQLTAFPATGWHFVGWSGDASGAASTATVTMDGPRSVTATFAINTYALDVTRVGEGVLTRTPDQPLYDHGTAVELSAQAAPGWHFLEWSGDASGSVNPLSVVMDAAKSITGTFAVNRYTLAVNVTGQGTVQRSPDQPDYAHGTEVQITATPATGWHFVGWGGDASGVSPSLTVTMDAVKSITATFAINTYALGVSISGSGSVLRSPDQPQYPHGTEVQLTATPATGWHLVAWGGDASGSTSPVTVTMDGPRSVTATFAINTYALALTVNGQGTVQRSPDQPTYDHGTQVELTATAAAGWNFVGWSGSAGGSASPITVTMDGPRSITATFAINTYPLAVTIVGDGAVQREPSQAQYPHGTTVQLTAVPAAGWRFVGWTGDATGSASPVGVLMDQPRAVTATFEQALFTLDVTVSGNGSVIRNPNQATYPEGSPVQLTAVPATGWYFVSWSGDASGSSNPLSLEMDADKAIHASFAISQYTLTLGKIGNGVVAKTPNQATYAHGTAVQASASPAPGYRFTGWLGDTTATTTPLPLTMTRDRTLTARFVETQPPVVHVDWPNGGETLTPGTTVQLRWTASDNGQVSSVDVMLSRNGIDGPYEVVGLGVANTGSLSWLVTGPGAAQAVLAVVAYDSVGNEGSDLSDGTFVVTGATAADDPPGPTALELAPVRPNPVPGRAEIEFSLPAAGPIRVSVTDIQGRAQVVLAEGNRPAGRHRVSWDGRIAGGPRLPAGVYFLRLEASGRRIVRRLVLAR